ncbi:MAG: thioredoxin family protein, partial [Planctomycetia bacterium]|nr:thioredoxin family protein [Planctomycetia bacterium]
MALTPSTMLPLGTRAPVFSLPDTTGKAVAIADFQNAPALLVMFICNHCPFVKHVRSGLAQLGKDYQPKGVAIVAISSNDVGTHPDDSPAKMAIEAKDAGYTFPYLYDESQSVARAYQAACTPDFFLFNREKQLVYRGQLDDSRPGNGIPVTGKDLR